MKVLIVMAGYFPGEKYGGPPVSIDNFCSLLSNYEVFIVTKDHDKGESKRYKDIIKSWNKRNNCKVKYLADSEYNRRNIENVIQEIEPNIIYLQSCFQKRILTCISLAKKYDIPVLLAPRGELCVGAMEIKKYKKSGYIRAVNFLGTYKGIHWQATSEEEKDGIIKWMDVDEKFIHIMANIPSVPRLDAREKYIKKRGHAEFVFISRIHPKKNLLGAIKFLNNISGSANFDIYGPIEDSEYWNKCKKEIVKLTNNVSVKYKGIVSHDKVHQIFYKYDAFLFPTFSENYGHVIAESLSVGTPVVISDKTPWSELVVNGLGYVIPLDYPQKYTEVLNRYINVDIIDKNLIREMYNNRMNIKEIEEQYRRTFELIISN